MRKKIICIANDFWPDSDEKWGFNLFKENGYEVEIWRVGALTVNYTVFEELKFNYTIRKFKTWKEFYFCLIKQEMKRTIFLFYSSGKKLHLSMAAIHVLGGKYCVIDFSSANNTRNAIFNEKKVKSTEKHWMDYFLPDYSFLGSRHNLSSINSKFQLEHGNNVYLHTYDYDVYLKDKYYNTYKSMIDIKHPYVLFVDQNFFDHKDQTNASMKKWIPDEETFIFEMQRFLNEVEKQFSLPVVVSAHPVTCKRIKEIYGNRQIVYGNTCGYTANADLVISSSSGAMGFAVMYQKPLLIYNNYQLKRNFFYMELQMPKSRILNAKIVNISKDVKNIQLSDYVTDVNYKEYIEYLTADVTQKELFMEEVLKYINGL